MYQLPNLSKANKVTIEDDVITKGLDPVIIRENSG